MCAAINCTEPKEAVARRRCSIAIGFDLIRSEIRSASLWQQLGRNAMLFYGNSEIVIVAVAAVAKQVI